MTSRAKLFTHLKLACFILVALRLTAVPQPDSVLANDSAQTPIEGFPMSEQSLQHLRDTNDVAGIRKHGWNLLEQLTKGGKPVWEKHAGEWKTKCDLGLSPLCKPARSRVGAEKPGTTASVQSLFTVRYSQDAATWIETNHLETGKGLQDIRGAGHGEISPPPPPTSIVIKEIWEGFNFSAPGDEPPLVAVFDPDSPQIDHDSPDFPNRFLQLEQWQSTLPVLLDAKTKDLDTRQQCVSDYPTATSNGQDAPVGVPINCFHFIRERERCDKLVKFEPLQLPQQPGLLHRDEPCVLVLVGLEIGTKEMKNWTWTTFWWTSQCKANGSNKCTVPGTTDRNTAGLPEGFTHFAMGTMLTPDVVPPNRDNDRNLALYNPYFEGTGHNGTLTNCMSCHARAVYVPKCFAGVDSCPIDRNGVFDPDQYIAPNVNPPVCTATPGSAQLKLCSLKTSFLWSLSTNQDKNTQFPFLLIHPIVLGTAAPDDPKKHAPTDSK